MATLFEYFSAREHAFGQCKRIIIIIGLASRPLSNRSRSLKLNIFQISTQQCGDARARAVPGDALTLAEQFAISIRSSVDSEYVSGSSVVRFQGHRPTDGPIFKWNQCV